MALALVTIVIKLQHYYKCPLDVTSVAYVVYVVNELKVETAVSRPFITVDSLRK